MSSRPAASVLLPVRDGGAHLDRALRSLARQTFRDFEVIVADDGSEDRSAEIARLWSGRDPRIRPLALARRGIAPALQSALEAARGPVLVRQDADDVSHPERFRLLMERLDREPETDVVGSHIHGFPRRAISLGMARYEDWQNRLIDHGEMFRERYVESPLAHASAALRRGPLEAAGGWRDRPWPEDLDLWFRLFRAGRRFAKIGRPLYFWGEGPERTTRTDPRLSLEAHRRCKIHHLETDFLGRPPGDVTLWSAGRLGNAWRDDLGRAGYRVDLVGMDPRRADRPPPMPGTPLLVAFTAPQHRERMRQTLAATGAVEGREYLCVY